MNFLACLLVISVTIVHAADYATTVVPGGIAVDNINNDKSVEVESVTDSVNIDPVTGLVNGVLESQLGGEQDGSSNDEVPTTLYPAVVSDNEPSSSATQTPTTVSSYIQTVPKRKMTTLPPVTVSMIPRRRMSTLAPLSPTLSSPAALTNSKLLKGWVADEIADALWAFAPQPSDNPKCTLHSQLYRNSINNFTMWAMQSEYTVYCVFIIIIIFILLVNLMFIEKPQTTSKYKKN